MINFIIGVTVGTIVGTLLARFFLTKFVNKVQADIAHLRKEVADLIAPTQPPTQ